MGHQLTALHLRTPARDERADRYQDLLARLSAGLDKAVVESKRLQSRAFLDALAEFQARLDDPTAASVEAFPDQCDSYFSRARAYLIEREKEYAELIDMLQSTLGRLAGDGTNFHDELLEVSTRLNRFAELDDIRQIKERVAKESSRLKTASDERREQEHRTVSTLTHRIEALQANLDEAQERAVTDPLTGIANRGRFDRMLTRWLTESERSREPFVLAMADIDNFKAINDAHGHPVGDRVILCTAQWLHSSVRATDMVARYGGEEFAVLFSKTTAAQAEARMNTVVQKLAAKPFEYDAEEGPRAIAVTISAGVAEVAPGDTADALVRRADEALYQAKRQGKNRVVVKSKGRLASLFR